MNVRTFLLAEDAHHPALQGGAAPAELSHERCRALQQDLVVAYTSPSFQRKLNALHALDASLEVQRLSLKRLVRMVQAGVLPMYSFDATDEGVALLGDALEQFPEGPEGPMLAAIIWNAMAGFVRNALEALDAAGGEDAVEAGDEAVAAVADDVVSVMAESEEGTRPLRHADAEVLLEELQQHFSSRRYQLLAMLVVDPNHFPLPPPRGSPTEFREWLPREISDLVLTAYAEVLPRFGFIASRAGVAQMWWILSPFLDDALMLERATVVIHSMIPSTELLWGWPRTYPRTVVEEDTRWPALSPEKAMEMQLELLTHYNTPQFQVQLNVLHRSYHPRSADFGQRLASLLGPVYTRVLPRYGFAGTNEGLEILTLAMGKAYRVPEVHALATAIDGLIYGMGPDPSERGTGVEASDERRLSKRQALQLLRDQLAAFSEPDFQLKVAALRCETLRAEHRRGEGRSLPAGCSRLALTMYQEILPRYDLQASPLGVHAMLQLCARHILDPEVARLVAGTNFLLGMEESACKNFEATLVKIRKEVVLPTLW